MMETVGEFIQEEWEMHRGLLMLNQVTTKAHW